VFDFDHTLTMSPSGGEPKLHTDYIEKMDLLVSMLEKLNKCGIVVYINTQSIAAYVERYLKDKIDKEYIRDVYGAISYYDLQNPFYPETVDDRLFIQGWRNRIINNLKAIARREGITDKADVYFFDDTAINVEYAKKQGFTNSFRIFDGTNPSDQSLIKTEKKYLEYTYVLVEDILSKMKST